MNSIIQSPTNNLKDSLDFYSSLGFQILSSENPTLVSDGKVLIEINPDRQARAGLKLYKPSWKETVEKLKAITKVIDREGEYVLSDPSGTWIYLMEGQNKLDAELSGIEPSVLGNYAGMSLEMIDIERSKQIWETLGFSVTMGAPEQGWVALANEDGLVVSLMKAFSCPHLFFNPSLTYFNGKNNLAIIEKIRSLNIPITEEITHFNKEGIVDNIIIRDPGGYGFFIFND